MCLVAHERSTTAAVAANMKDGNEYVPRETFSLHPNHSKLSNWQPLKDQKIQRNQKIRRIQIQKRKKKISLRRNLSQKDQPKLRLSFI